MLILSSMTDPPLVVFICLIYVSSYTSLSYVTRSGFYPCLLHSTSLHQAPGLKSCFHIKEPCKQVGLDHRSTLFTLYWVSDNRAPLDFWQFSLLKHYRNLKLFPTHQISDPPQDNTQLPEKIAQLLKSFPSTLQIL